MRIVATGWVRTLIALLVGCVTLCGCWNFEGLACRQVRDSVDCDLDCAPPWAAYADCYIDEFGSVLYRPRLPNVSAVIVSVSTCGGSVEYRSILRSIPAGTAGTTCDGDPYTFDTLPYYSLGPKF